jgi:hypothetical protein
LKVGLDGFKVLAEFVEGFEENDFVFGTPKPPGSSTLFLIGSTSQFLLLMFELIVWVL